LAARSFCSVALRSLTAVALPSLNREVRLTMRIVPDPQDRQPPVRIADLDMCDVLETILDDLVAVDVHQLAVVGDAGKIGADEPVVPKVVKARFVTAHDLDEQAPVREPPGPHGVPVLHAPMVATPQTMIFHERRRSTSATAC